MILELVDIRIHPGQQEAFDAAILQGIEQCISKATGYIEHRVNKGIEMPERYVLMIHWETLENHTIDFRESAAFVEWRKIVGPFFATPPHVEHFTIFNKSDAGSRA
jgi:heme-degrading monooxygenase HmoA